MEKRKMDKLGIAPSLLGFGCMRFPTLADGKIDEVIAEKMLDVYLQKFKLANRDIRLFRKIINLFDTIPYPGDLKNIIKTAIAFSSPTDGTDYFRRLYYAVCGAKPEDLKKLQTQNFTVREIEILTQKSKSSVARELKGVEQA